MINHVSILQVNIGDALAPQLHGKWYAINTQDKTVFNKDTKAFSSNVDLSKFDKYSTTSPGLIAHMIKSMYPMATITIHPSTVK